RSAAAPSSPSACRPSRPRRPRPRRRRPAVSCPRSCPLMSSPESRKPPLANLDGQSMPLAEVRIPALDRGFLFGDAVYEVLRVYRGRMWLEDEPFARLSRSLEAVRIRGVDVERLRRRVHDTIAAGPFVEALVYLQVTRGVAPRAHPFPAGVKPLEFFYVQEFV